MRQTFMQDLAHKGQRIVSETKHCQGVTTILKRCGVEQKPM